jgi:hypothetical protein
MNIFRIVIATAALIASLSLAYGVYVYSQPRDGVDWSALGAFPHPSN